MNDTGVKGEPIHLGHTLREKPRGDGKREKNGGAAIINTGYAKDPAQGVLGNTIV